MAITTSFTTQLHGLAQKVFFCTPNVSGPAATHVCVYHLYCDGFPGECNTPGIVPAYFQKPVFGCTCRKSPFLEALASKHGSTYQQHDDLQNALSSVGSVPDATTSDDVV
jgi:hypothetical protein